MKTSPAYIRIKYILLDKSCEIFCEQTLQISITDNRIQKKEKGQITLLSQYFNFFLERKYLIRKSCNPVTLKIQSHEISDLWVFSSNNTPGSTDSWAKAVSNIDSHLRRYSTMKIAKFQFYFTAMGLARSPMTIFCYTVALTAVIKAETLVFRLCTKTHSAGFLLKIFICNSALCNSV
jgi:hypothetical protein